MGSSSWIYGIWDCNFVTIKMFLQQQQKWSLDHWTLHVSLNWTCWPLVPDNWLQLGWNWPHTALVALLDRILSYHWISNILYWFDTNQTNLIKCKFWSDSEKGQWSAPDCLHAAKLRHLYFSFLIFLYFCIFVFAFCVIFCYVYERWTSEVEPWLPSCCQASPLCGTAAGFNGCTFIFFLFLYIINNDDSDDDDDITKNCDDDVDC